jgi:DNA-binding CsgD family transcriptional regulator
MAETALLLPRPGSLAPLTAVVHRLQPGSRWLTHLAATVAVHVIDPDRYTIPRAILAQLYGLTGAEAATLQALVQGRGVPHTAGRLGSSRNTTKTHLARILAKIAAAGQSELVRLTLQGPAMIRWNRQPVPRPGRDNIEDDCA